jgi:hypothetical protein
MDGPRIRRTISKRLAVAHLVGLWTTGMAGTIGTSAGFSFLGGGWGLFLGGLLSLPWILALFAVVWRWHGWVDRHPVQFALIGPIVVSGSYAAIDGAFLKFVAISCVTSSICYLLLVYRGRARASGESKKI